MLLYTAFSPFVSQPLRHAQVARSGPAAACCLQTCMASGVKLSLRMHITRRLLLQVRRKAYNQPSSHAAAQKLSVPARSLLATNATRSCRPILPLAFCRAQQDQDSLQASIPQGRPQNLTSHTLWRRPACLVGCISLRCIRMLQPQRIKQALRSLRVLSEVDV